MNTDHWLLLLWRVLRSTIINTLLLALFTALVCWFGGWHTLLSYSNGLIYAGAALFFVGSLLFIGGQSRTSHYPRAGHGFSPTPVDDRKVLNFENSKQRQTDISDAIRTAATLIFPAILSIIIGLILVSTVN